MGKKVYIVHSSVIVQYGLSEIIRKNFKCIIKCYFDFFNFLKSEDKFFSKSIIFIEDKMANADEYLKFIDQTDELISIRIINCKSLKNNANNQYSIFLNSSQDEIFEQLKNSFKHQKIFKDSINDLTVREIDVLKLVALGYSNKKIAEKLYISPHTVMSHRKNITEKLGIKSISGLTVYAIINNFIDTSDIELKDLI